MNQWDTTVHISHLSEGLLAREVRFSGMRFCMYSTCGDIIFCSLFSCLVVSKGIFDLSLVGIGLVS